MDEYVINELKEFIKRLKANKNAYIFLQPIEELINTLVDYKEKIQSPIDLLKIEQKLSSSKYNSIEEMKDDLDRMLTNCLTYNYDPDNTNWVNKVTLQFQEFLNNNWNKMRQKIDKHIEKRNNYLLQKQQLKEAEIKSISHAHYHIANEIIDNNIAVFTYEDDKIGKRVKNLFASIKPFLNITDEARENIVNLLIKSISKRNKSFDQIYDDTMKFVTKHLTVPENKPKFAKKFRKLLRTLKEEQSDENAKMDSKALNIKIDLNENEEKREEKEKLDKIRKEVENFVDNQKIPEVFRDNNEYPIEQNLKKKILAFVFGVRTKMTTESEAEGNEKNDLMDLDF